MKRRFPWIKFIIGAVLFAFAHQLYDFFPSRWAAILAEGEQESIFAHMKMLFYPYILISAVDYLWQRRKGPVGDSFLYARLLILVSAPWMFISVFYVPESLGLVLGEPYLLIYSILISWIGVYIAIRMEEPLEATEYRPAMKTLLWLLFISALITYTGFSIRLPEHGFFV